MSKVKVWVLTVDSESWLGSEIHPTREAAFRSLVESSDWIDIECDPYEDEDAFRDEIGEESIYYDIEEQVIDINNFEEIK